MTYSSIAREYLLREGISPDTVIKTGSPMFEVLNYYKPNILKSNILDKLNLKKAKYFLVSAHREENIQNEKNFKNLINSLNSIAKIYKYPVIVSTHPRTKNRLDKENIKFRSEIKFLKPFGFYDYNFLQLNAITVLSDSGTISEEASILNFKALNIREAHERPEAMEEGAVMMVGLKSERILQALTILKNQNTESNRTILNVNDYSKPNVSEKVLRIIMSYTDYVNTNSWRK